VFTSEPQEIPFEVKVPRKDGEGTKELFDEFVVHNYEDSYLGSATIADATTYSDNSVYSQLGTQVGVENVAATAAEMGIETDLSSDFDYSINDSPFHPYNPAIVLGGLQTGVTPLEMAHAYNTLAADGRRLSGTMASNSGGPVAILKVTDGENPTEGELVPDQTGASGENELIDKQVIDPVAAQTAKDVLSTVVSSGTGRRAQSAESTWGKTGTTDDNGDAWFCGATPKFTACIWVGYRDTVTPMETEFAGAPVDGGTFPALIFAQIAAAYDEVDALHASDEEEDDASDGGGTSDDDASVTDSTTVAPPVDEEAIEVPAEPAPVPEEAAPAEPVAPESSGSNGAPAAPTSGGGVAPG
jgi:penicillin-binding protein 1A